MTDGYIEDTAIRNNAAVICSRFNTKLPTNRLAALLLSAVCWVPVAAWASAVTIRSPAPRAVVVGEIAVYAEAADPAEVTGVQFLVQTPDRGRRNLGTQLSAPPYTVTWDTTTAGDGIYRLSALAHFRDGSAGYANPVEVTVANGCVTKRFEETAASIVWGDNWIHDGAYGTWSGGSAEYTVDAGAYAVFTFTGSGVSWIGYRGRYGGIVRIYVDGVFNAEIDTYAPEEATGTAVYTLSGLERGTHSLMIGLTGRMNPQAGYGETAIDAFDVMQ